MAPGNGTVSGIISNSSAGAKVGVSSTLGVWTLSGTNTYSGGTTVGSTNGTTLGTLNINNSSAIGTGMLTINAGSTIDNTSGAPVTLSTNNAITFVTMVFWRHEQPEHGHGHGDDHLQ